MQQERAENQPPFGGLPAGHSEATQPIAPPVPAAGVSPAAPFGGAPAGTPFGGPAAGAPFPGFHPTGSAFPGTQSTGTPFGGAQADAPFGVGPSTGAPFGGAQPAAAALPGAPGGGSQPGQPDNARPGNAQPGNARPGSAQPGNGQPAGTFPPVPGWPSASAPSSPGVPPGGMSGGAPNPPHIPGQRPANPDHPAGREQPPADYGREHFTGPLRSSRAAQHRAGDEQKSDPDRTVGLPRPADPGHPANAETMILPAFVTGRKEPEPEPAPKPAEPARNQNDGSLPASEKGMLLFVAALLGLGGIAVVIMLGVGGLDKHRAPAPPAVHSTGTPAGGAPAAPGSSPSSAGTPPASPASIPTSAVPPTVAKTTAKRIAPSPTPTLLGQAQPLAYCIAKDRGLDKAPNGDSPTWTCTTSHRGKGIPFTPAQVCDWQYGTSSYAVVGSLADPSTWNCYKQ
ncbi:hypothetical protein GCM10023322_49200 [Rugosimonospora acidiphila]|uniref:Uncharacterized protein n=1 Tax=Rugosimonospora acidiphila TaxID=556531 RepID=A0ABP9S5A5_9ACTN